MQNSLPEKANLSEPPERFGGSHRFAITRQDMKALLKRAGWKSRVTFNASGPVVLASRTGKPPFYGVTVPALAQDDHAESLKRLRRMIKTMESMTWTKK